MKAVKMQAPVFEPSIVSSDSARRKPDEIILLTVQSQSEKDTMQDIKNKALQLVFTRLDAIHAVHRQRWLVAVGPPRYIDLICDLKPAYPEPDFGRLESRNDVESLLLLMRHPCLHDAGSDLLFERYFKSAVNLIYRDYQVTYLPYVIHQSITIYLLKNDWCRDTDCIGHTNQHSASADKHHLPTLIAGERVICM